MSARIVARRTWAKTLPNGDYIEVEAEERDDSGTLSAGFSITGSVWESRYSAGRRTQTGKNRHDRGRGADMGGCIHDEILEHFPELAPLVAVHLADPTGLPMHAVENGWYFYSGAASAYERKQIAAGRDYGYSRNLETSDHDRAARALCIPPADLPRFPRLGSRAAFAEFVEGLAPRYAADAAAARALLAAIGEGES